jgi:1-acyl-sn-glycerol-3-phosphate acyltransferase
VVEGTNRAEAPVATYATLGQSLTPIRTLLAYVHTVYAVLLAGFFAFACTLLILPLGLLRRGEREQWASPVARAFGWLCIHLVLFARPEVIGSNHLPTRRGYLVVCNHRSWLDVLLLVWATDSIGISKREIGWIPCLGLGGKIAGAIFFDRRDRDARANVVAEALSMMSRNANIHLFPEGTRTRSGALAEKVHLRLIAETWKHNIPVVPACVWETENTLPSGRWLVFGGRKAGLEIATPPNPRDFSDGQSYAQAVWDCVRAMALRHGAHQEWAA